MLRITIGHVLEEKNVLNRGMLTQKIIQINCIFKNTKKK